ncbi:TolC family protein [Methylomonas koyamae]|uniref:TolC family protein n=1 Tax=Methylomonas koyamae TaxID=702114 RepID=UPI000ACF940F|nr:TolC family protein [Methylomonas koyamae]
MIAAQYNIDQARAEQVVAGAIPNPVFGVQISEIGNNPNMGSNAIGCNHSPSVSCGPAEYFPFSQLIEVAGKRGLRMQSSGFATQAAESDLRDAVRIFSNMVRDAYFDLLLAQNRDQMQFDRPRSGQFRRRRPGNSGGVSGVAARLPHRLERPIREPATGDETAGDHRADQSGLDFRLVVLDLHVG